MIAAFLPAVHSAREADWTIRDGRLHADGKRVFLKIGKPLSNFADPAACDRLAAELDTLRAKGFNAVTLNCYWHHFDADGDGTIDASLEPLARLIDAIQARGMFPCLSVETYGVGGGQIPQAFWQGHPEAVAINAEGQEARDAESLADWVNGDAAAFRSAAGDDAYIAVDYLETCDDTMPRRNGDSIRFLEALTCADIIQVNWHWRTDLPP